MSETPSYERLLAFVTDLATSQTEGDPRTDEQIAESWADPDETYELGNDEAWERLIGAIEVAREITGLDFDREAWRG